LHVAYFADLIDGDRCRRAHFRVREARCQELRRAVS
jgi:hypothetical protein